MDGTPEETTEKVETTEPTKEDTLKTETDSSKETPEETQVLLKRYKEQVAGSQKEAQELKERIAQLESRVPPEEKEPQAELSPQDEAYRKYLISIGMIPQKEVDERIRKETAPFRAKMEAQEKAEQTEIIKDFTNIHTDLNKEKDIDGFRMKQVIEKLRRITPADPFNPNKSLKEDLEFAYHWAFGKETSEEALSKAKAEGRAEGHEAAEMKVGEGAPIKSTSPKKRTPEQEALLQAWGVDDNSLTKK